MDIWELVQAIKDKPDDEIAKMTSILPVTLTVEEVKLVRPIFDKASLQWLLFGPPAHVHKQLQGILGKTRTKKLFTHFGL
ncbi:hypothetical protein MHH33_07935 [Paenisporosarcina sp. FSL H8-0542]|uniref:hypothetical protein n=1 Tax=unclassified Paenisporosarcina TaxID=2642018 RepID=UPI00034ECB6D|nr:hypothetical protein [Paenisporosarcina sp. HGH0030]EPD53579.1 hypothetical protein HMPREF1210_00402 [Paenisporosarcina sp. HGH0030]